MKAPKDASGNYNTFDCGNLPAAAKPIKFSFTPVPATTTTPAIAQEVSIDIQQLVFRTDDNVCTLRVQPQPAGDATKQNYWDFGLPLFRSVCSLVNVNGKSSTSLNVVNRRESVTTGWLPVKGWLKCFRRPYQFYIGTKKRSFCSQIVSKIPKRLERIIFFENLFFNFAGWTTFA